jgi:hypothetical protein
MFQMLCGLMASGGRSMLVSRWRTGGKTNFDLVHEYVKELPNVPAAESWQRACLLARDTALDASREPRLKRTDESAEMPTADHPFFWAGYLLVDTGPGAGAEAGEPADGAVADGAKADAPAKAEVPTEAVPKEDGLPAPEKPGAAPVEDASGKAPAGRE